MRKKLLKAFGGLAAVVGITAFTLPAQADGHVYSGTGWKIETHNDIHSLSPDPYVIELVKPTTGDRLTTAQNRTAEAQLRQQLTRTAAQLTTITGTTFTLSADYHSVETSCSAAERHVIVVGLRYRPSPGAKPGTSQTWPCYASADNSTWGSWIWMDSEYWDPAVWTIERWRLANVESHEMGHAVGLDHPNVDGSDAGTTADPYGCVTNRSKDTPVMCSPNGGYAAGSGGSLTRAKKNAGRYTRWDISGLQALKANFG